MIRHNRVYILNQSEHVIEPKFYKLLNKKPIFLKFSCYIEFIQYMQLLMRYLNKVFRLTGIPERAGMNELNIYSDMMMN